MKIAWIQFLQVKGELAIRNLTVLITITIASVIVLVLTVMRDKDGKTQLSEGIFMGYLLAGAGVYGFGKWQDEKTSRFEINPIPPPPPLPPITNVTNQVTNASPGENNVTN